MGVGRLIVRPLWLTLGGKTVTEIKTKTEGANGREASTVLIGNGAALNVYSTFAVKFDFDNEKSWGAALTV